MLMNNANRNARGLVFAILSAVSWGTYGTFIKVLSNQGFSRITLAAMSPTVLATAFLVYVLLTKPTEMLVGWKIGILMLLNGCLILGGMNYMYVQSVSLLPVGIVSIISFCHIIPLMLTTRIVFGYQITREKIGASLVALAGISLVLEVYKFGAASLNPLGIFWALAVAAAMAVEYTLIKYYIKSGVHYQVYILYLNFFAGSVYWFSTPPWKILSETLTLASEKGPSVWTAVLGFSLIPLIGSYVTFAKAYQCIEPTFVSIMSSLDPVTATLLGFFFLGQRLSGTQLFGIAVVLIPLIYIQYVEGKKDVLPFSGSEHLRSHSAGDDFA
jgi:drug/metabolite transporter (DMT)-like permease